MEYGALLAGLGLAKEMHVRRLVISSDSQLVVSQFNDNFSVKDKNMIAYLKLVMELVPTFEKFELAQIPCTENAHTDALSKLANIKNSELLTIVPVEHISRPSTSKSKKVMWVESTPPWMKPIIAFFKNQVLSCDNEETKKFRR